jgi:hypothetical protein
MRFLCIGFWAVEIIAICIGRFSPPTQLTGLYQASGKYGFPCGLCGSLCTLQLSCSAFASVTIATLGMNGWLGLVQ